MAIPVVHQPSREGAVTIEPVPLAQADWRSEWFPIRGAGRLSIQAELIDPSHSWTDAVVGLEVALDHEGRAVALYAASKVQGVVGGSHTSIAEDAAVQLTGPGVLMGVQTPALALARAHVVTGDTGGTPPWARLRLLIEPLAVSPATPR